MIKAPSPLFVWKLVLIAIVIALAVLSRIDPVEVHIKQRRESLNKKITTVTTTKKETDIVFFGNSLLQAGLPASETQISAKLTAAADRTEPIRVVNLAQDGRSSWDISHRAAQIFALNPKVIVVQTEMIIGRQIARPKNFRVTHGELYKRLHDWAKFLRAPLMRTFHN